MAASLVEFESSLPAVEQEVVKLLKVIEGLASKAELRLALYEFRGLLPKLESPRQIVDSYLALRQSDYFSTAASLAYFIIQSARVYHDEQRQLNEIHKYIQKNSTYEADEHIPSLNLRLTMSKIADGFDESQTKDFITLASEHLQLHADKFDDDLLTVFDKMEECGSLDPKDAKLEPVRKWLTDLRRLDLVKKLDEYIPYRPFRIAVMKDVKREFIWSDVHVSSTYS